MKQLLLGLLGSWAVTQVALAQPTRTVAPAPPAPGVPTSAPAADRFHRLLARATGQWTGQATMTFSPAAPPVTSTSTLTNTMAMGGLFQVSEIVYTSGGRQIRGIRITGYDADKQIFTRAMIQDGGNGVAMEGPWDEATQSVTMRYKQRESQMKEVYTFVDERTELLELYRLDETTGQEQKILHVKWTRDSIR